MSNYYYVILAIVVSLGFTLLTMPLLLKICYKKRLYDIPNERKVHKILVPRLGGILFLVSAIVCFILANYVVNHKQGDVCEQCDIFLDDPEKTLDSLYLNDIYKDYKRTNYKEDVTNLINYISYKIENSEQKEIK